MAKKFYHTNGSSKRDWPPEPRPPRHVDIVRDLVITAAPGHQYRVRIRQDGNIEQVIRLRNPGPLAGPPEIVWQAGAKTDPVMAQVIEQAHARWEKEVMALAAARRERQRGRQVIA
jgi:hypothetical protein